MGDPKTKKSRVSGSSTREKIYTKCLQLFYEKGFKGTTMRNIAEGVDIEAASIYNYIDSKLTLLEEWLFEMSKSFHEGILDIIDSSYCTRDKIRAIIALHIRITSQNPYKAALLTNEWRNLQQPALSRFIMEREHYEVKVKTIIQEGIELGELRSVNAEIFTQSFLGSLRWIFHWYIKHQGEINPVELEKQLMEIIMKGVAR